RNNSLNCSNVLIGSIGLSASVPSFLADDDAIPYPPFDPEGPTPAFTNAFPSSPATMGNVWNQLRSASLKNVAAWHIFAVSFSFWRVSNHTLIRFIHPSASSERPPRKISGSLALLLIVDSSSDSLSEVQ